MAAAILSVVSGAKLLEATLGGAMKMETDQITLKALVGDAQKANQLFDMLNKKGLASTLSEGDYLNMGKAFLPITKSLKDIDKLTSISERLYFANPLQGSEGAAFAIREALSGDLVSLQERFNVPRSMLKDTFKGADTLTEKIAALDKVLNKMGYTQQFVTEVNKSASSQWDMFKSNVTAALAKIGTGALERLKPQLEALNKWFSGDGVTKFVQKGSEALINIVTKAIQLKDVFTRDVLPVLSSTASALKSVADVVSGNWSTIGPVIGTVTAALIGYQTAVKVAAAAQWLLNAAAAANPIGLVVAAITAAVYAGYQLYKNWDTIKQSASDMWVTLKNAFAEGVNWVIGKLNTLIDALNSAFSFQLPDWLGGKSFNLNLPKIPELQLDYSVQQRKMEEFRQKKALGIDGSHAGGLSNVPYDGYVARLHKGERVLTAAENERYSGGGGGKVIQFGDIHLHGVGGDMEKAAEDLMRIIARKVHQAGMQMA